MPKNIGSRPKLSRHQKRDLEVEIGFLEGLIRRDPDYVDALQVLGDDYTRRGDYEAGLKVDESLARLCPRDPTVLYNLACSYALTMQAKQAVSALVMAIDRGYRDFKWLLKDPDLLRIRKNPLFRQVEQKIQAVKIKIH
jgi:tetratricopeptide (TPR) repeat protein